MNSTLSPNENQAPKFQISDYLGRGEKNARTMKELRQATGMTPRQIRRCIAAERRHVPISSSCDGYGGGYFIAATPEEGRRFYESMMCRAREIERAASFVLAQSATEGGRTDEH